MDEIDKVRLLAELDSEFCELHHGPETRKEDFPATDYIVLPVGFKKNEVQDITVRDLVIPVCFACAQALIGKEWVLLYCFECGESRWVCKELAKNSYRHQILWLRGCPDCTNKFGGLYFTDQPEQAAQLQFLIGAQKSYVVA